MQAEHQRIASGLLSAGRPLLTGAKAGLFEMFDHYARASDAARYDPGNLYVQAVRLADRAGGDLRRRYAYMLVAAALDVALLSPDAEGVLIPLDEAAFG